jgi:Uma2 family endonuclease
MDLREIWSLQRWYEACCVARHGRSTVMESMSSPETILRSSEPIRPLKRVEFERLAAEGFFDDERVELLFGLVVPMSPISPPHGESCERLRELLVECLDGRARVRSQNAFAASDISEPQPDVVVVPAAQYWQEHPTHAYLVVEVAWSSLAKDRGPKAVLYARADVDEYWIVDVEGGVVEVFRDHVDGEWRSRTTYRRGETVAMAAFPDVTVAVSDVLPPL